MTQLIMTEDDPNSPSELPSPPPPPSAPPTTEPELTPSPEDPTPSHLNAFKERIHHWQNTIKSHSKELLNKENLNKVFNKENLAKMVQDFDPQAFTAWVSHAVQKRGANFYGTLLTIVLSTYFMSDLTSLILGEYIPESLNSRPSRFDGNYGRQKNFNDYGVITSRNLFNSQGLIPGEEANPGGNSGSNDLGGPPVKTTLPLNLVGTLIMNNELRSIATIEDKSASTVYPVRVDDEIPNKIRILKIEPRKVIFVNQSSGRREYVELPDDGKPLANQNVRLTPGSGGGGVEKVSSTQFNVSRSEVDKALADFNNILTQARAVPNFENGVAAGYKLFQIVPGSIYDKLGLQNGDVIVGLNGSPINDPAKAFEMISELKTSNHLELQVKKDGKPSTYTYDIR